MYNYVITAPGQGVQQPGMLDAWLAAVPQAHKRITEWSDIVGFDMVPASRDEVMLGDTAIAQPLIVAAALLSFELLRDRMDSDDVLFAGHSVGELAAAAGAGYISATTAITLAGVRGAAMSAACAVTESGMAAVMPTKRDGATDAAIVAAIGAAGLIVANWNGSHQFVAAGTKDRIDAFIEARPRGLRIVPLTVAGAFHTDAMATATPSFAKAAAEAAFLESASAMVGNGDGALITSPDDLRQRLIAQITAPVRWDLCARTIAAHAATDAPHLELAPAGPLTRLLERERPEARALAIRTPEDIDPTAEAA
ncbi:ACP S-malonyltransferase [Nocardia sp. CA-120079]|uniref:ACP S-malonyltransferase n=1 Tax=Nocardia sp. CA-120079 TaxID=3239974 RepID=UPI003D96AE0F